MSAGNTRIQTAPHECAKPRHTSLVVCVVILTLMALLSLTGCGGAGDSERIATAKGRVQFKVYWPQPTRQQDQNSNPKAYALGPAGARSMEVRLIGSNQRNFVDIEERPSPPYAAENTVPGDSNAWLYRSEEISLNDLGGPISFSQGAKVTLIVTFYSGFGATGEPVGRYENRDVIINNTSTLRVRTGDNKETDLENMDLDGQIDTLEVTATGDYPVGVYKAVTVTARTGNRDIVPLPADGIGLKVVSGDAAVVGEYIKPAVTVPLIVRAWLKRGIVGGQDTGVVTDDSTLRGKEWAEVTILPKDAVDIASVFSTASGNIAGNITTPTEGADETTLTRIYPDEIPLLAGQQRQYSAAVTVPEFATVRWSKVSGPSGVDVTENGLVQAAPGVSGELVARVFPRVVSATYPYAGMANASLPRETRVRLRVIASGKPGIFAPDAPKDPAPDSISVIDVKEFTDVHTEDGLPTIPASSVAYPRRVLVYALTPDNFDVTWSVIEPGGGAFQEAGNGRQSPFAAGDYYYQKNVGGVAVYKGADGKPTLAASSSAPGAGDTRGLAAAVYIAPERGGIFTLRATSKRDANDFTEIKVVVKATSVSAEVN